MRHCQAFATSLFLVTRCLAPCLLVTGCGSAGPSLGEVHGRVTIDGKAVNTGRIMFHPETGRSATGEIRSDGTYSLTTFKQDDGAMVGKHRITIKAVDVVPNARPVGSTDLDQKQGGTVRWLVPERYSAVETSLLTAEVTAGVNTINFNIPTGR